MNTYITNIIDDMLHSEYEGAMQSRHLSVGIMKNKVITPYKYNKLQDYVFGEFRGSCHAEMNVVSSILNAYNSLAGYHNYFPWYISKGQRLL
jgi:hypothetical protein